LLQLRADRIVKAIAINQAQRFGPILWLKRTLGRERGGNVLGAGREDILLAHVEAIFSSLRRFAGDITGKTVIEIGPGDNLGVAYGFLRAGCSKVTAVEKISTITIDEYAARVLRRLDARLTGPGPTFDQVARREGATYVLDPGRLEVRRAAFEDLRLDEEVDVIYSNDVLEHVDDPAAVFRGAYRLLKPGGLFINSIDFGAHNVFAWNKRERPLDFLTCDDWLWSLMFSRVQATNRVRYSEILDAARAAGYAVRSVDVTHRVSHAYLAEIRRHLLPRYQALSDDDLSVVECVLVVEKRMEAVELQRISPADKGDSVAFAPRWPAHSVRDG
jgi:SAM-dependent methyltransferase